MFIIKWKHKFNVDFFNEIIDSKSINSLINSNKLLFIDESVNSSCLINSSAAVISMAFTSPSLEALSCNKPGVFYDPISLMNQNYLQGVPGLYLINKSQLTKYIQRISSFSESMNWVKETKLLIGLSSNDLGIKKIHKDIEDYFNL